jgi:hypothetical protein
MKDRTTQPGSFCAKKLEGYCNERGCKFPERENPSTNVHKLVVMRPAAWSRTVLDGSLSARNTQTLRGSRCSRFPASIPITRTPSSMSGLCDILCGNVYFFLLEKDGDHWKVPDKVMIWIIVTATSRMGQNLHVERCKTVSLCYA